jgi:hypothetical protein
MKSWFRSVAKSYNTVEQWKGYLWKPNLEMDIDISLVFGNIIDVLYNVTSIDSLNKQFLSVYSFIFRCIEKYIDILMTMHAQTWNQMNL